jgi:beta-N-acetylhexosaminidase
MVARKPALSKYTLFVPLFLLLFFVLYTTCTPRRSRDVKYGSEPSLETKIGQMIMLGFAGTDSDNIELISKEQIADGEIGGILILPSNIVDCAQLQGLIKDIKSIPTVYPLLVAIDQEGGRVSRLNKAKGFMDFPSHKEVARTRMPREAFLLYLRMAGIVKELGINLNLAPVVDLDINPDSPAVGKMDRSFSANPDIVYTYARQFIVAHRKMGVLTALKHYPGHGSAKDDSHLGLVDITGTWKKSELIPYRTLIKKGLADTVMCAHVVNSDIDDKYPASLSVRHIEENLRESLGFDGVIITDDLQMKAISNMYTLEEVVINSVNAGCDILLFANYFNSDSEMARKVKEIIIRAARDGKIKRERIEESFRRIMELKKSYSR